VKLEVTMNDFTVCHPGRDTECARLRQELEACEFLLRVNQLEVASLRAWKDRQLRVAEQELASLRARTDLQALERRVAALERLMGSMGDD
jgi:hypothetical protein